MQIFTRHWRKLCHIANRELEKVMLEKVMLSTLLSLYFALSLLCSLSTLTVNRGDKWQSPSVLLFKDSSTQ